jgi:hypothetical protein
MYHANAPRQAVARSPDRLPARGWWAARATTITIRNADKRIGAHVFAAVARTMSRARAGLGSRLTTENNPKDAIDRIHHPGSVASC